MTDCFFAKITDIKPHPNADKLSIGKVGRWQVVVPKNVWEENERGLFVCPDATLPSNIEKYSWAKNYLTYLGSHNRVKIIKLRDELSNGLFIKLEEIKAFDENLLDEKDTEELARSLGIIHYVESCDPSEGKISNCLPYGIPKTDEDNYQSLKDNPPFGETVLLTRKIDGSSVTMTATPDGEFKICSRTCVYNPEFTKSPFVSTCLPFREKLLAYAKKLNQIVAIRGELSGHHISVRKHNKDCKTPVKFSMFGVYFPEEANKAKRSGFYGQDTHFLKVAQELDIQTVPIIGTAVLTPELCEQLILAPAEDGEGVVINHSQGSFKCVSAEYYSKMK